MITIWTAPMDSRTRDIRERLGNARSGHADRSRARLRARDPRRGGDFGGSLACEGALDLRTIRRDIGASALADEGEDRVHRNRLIVLIAHLDVPVHDTLRNLPLAILLDRLLLASEASVDRVADVYGLHEAEPLQAVVGKHGSGRWIDEESRRRGEH